MGKNGSWNLPLNKQKMFQGWGNPIVLHWLPAAIIINNSNNSYVMIDWRMLNLIEQADWGLLLWREI